LTKKILKKKKTGFKNDFSSFCSLMLFLETLLTPFSQIYLQTGVDTRQNDLDAFVCSCPNYYYAPNEYWVNRESGSSTAPPGNIYAGIRPASAYTPTPPSPRSIYAGNRTASAYKPTPPPPRSIYACSRPASAFKEAARPASSPLAPT
jgi:hypothetical protein